MSPNSHPSPPEVSFTVDGEAFTTSDRKQSAGEMLTRYAHLSPTEYELGELHGKDPEPKVYNTDATVEIHPGARYISLRIGPGPVE